MEFIVHLRNPRLRVAEKLERRAREVRDNAQVIKSTDRMMRRLALEPVAPFDADETLARIQPVKKLGIGQDEPPVRVRGDPEPKCVEDWRVAALEDVAVEKAGALRIGHDEKAEWRIKRIEMIQNAVNRVAAQLHRVASNWLA
jgi:hypothetical protein